MKDGKASNVQLFWAGPDVNEVVGRRVGYVGKGLTTRITKISIREESMNFQLKKPRKVFQNTPEKVFHSVWENSSKIVNLFQNTKIMVCS